MKLKDQSFLLFYELKLGRTDPKKLLKDLNAIQCHMRQKKKTPRMDKHSRYGITECCLPKCKGTMRLQKLTLLWMLEDARKMRKKDKSASKGKKGKR